MDTMEKFYIYKQTTKGNQPNDIHTITPQKISEAILTGEGHLTSVTSPLHLPFTSCQLTATNVKTCTRLNATL